MRRSRYFVSAGLAIVVAGLAHSAMAQSEIKIGEINSYSLLPAFTEPVWSENVVMLTGTFLSNIGLAVSDFANQKKVFFLAAEPLTDAITWAKGNRYTF